ncbi:histamine H3 receptor-like [Paramacrobiotus metropolitanus]|uniref:histamine H3 receptor-like n=1 Tax=Paramacrobiotus metropolitanus TaxID=2943436 RepID=UPI00244618BC|nr:histamine H3 receptor-like [Paramacrobiotus metropolitanus]
MFQRLNNTTVSFLPNNTDATAVATVSPANYALASTVAVICTGTLIYNALVILAFVKDPSIRQPFMFYLLNVSLCDFGLAGISMTGFVWFTLSPAASATYCPYYNFLDKIFTIGTGYTVLLVSLDRAFSLFFPLRYRYFRSNRSTLAVCGLTWLGITGLCGPYVVMDALWYRSMTLPCVINGPAQKGYSLVMEFAAYDAPAVLVLLCTTVIVVKLYGRSQLRRLIKGTGKKMPITGSVQ